MKLFGHYPFLFEEAVDAIPDSGGGGGETALATIPSGRDTSTDTPSGDTGAIVPFRGQLYTDDHRISVGVRPILDAFRHGGTVDLRALGGPAFENQLRKVLHENRQLRSEFGGIQGARDRIAELEQQVAEFGGPEELSEARGELEFFHNLDAQFTAGDPRFIQAMIDAPGGRDAFLKLAPAMMAEYERLWPEGFSHWLNGKMLDMLRGADFRVNLLRVKDYLGMLPNTQENPAQQNALAFWNALAQINDWLMESVKNKPASAAPVAAAAATDNRASELDSREIALKKREFANAGRDEINAEFSRQWKALAKGTSAIQSHVRPSFDLKMQAALKADKSVDKAIQGYFSRNDVEGYRLFQRAQYQKHGARILKAELGHYRTGKVAASVTSGAPPVPQPVASRTEAGWTILGRPLTAAERALVNYDVPGVDTRSMYFEGKAYLKDGRKVQFKR